MLDARLEFWIFIASQASPAILRHAGAPPWSKNRSMDETENPAHTENPITHKTANHFIILMRIAIKTKYGNFSRN